MLIIDKSANGFAQDYSLVSDDADFTFSGDFTVELFGVIFNSVPSNAKLIGHYNDLSPLANNRSWLLDYVSGALRLLVSSDGTSGGTTTISNTWTPSTATPYNLAFDRSGSTCRIYRDGSMVQSGTKAGALFNSGAKLTIGFYFNGNTVSNIFPGSCKAIRITNGVARYATNGSYTVPTLPLPTS